MGTKGPDSLRGFAGRGGRRAVGHIGWSILSTLRFMSWSSSRRRQGTPHPREVPGQSALLRRSSSGRRVFMGPQQRHFSSRWAAPVAQIGGAAREDTGVALAALISLAFRYRSASGGHRRPFAGGALILRVAHGSGLNGFLRFPNLFFENYPSCLVGTGRFLGSTELMVGGRRLGAVKTSGSPRGRGLPIARSSTGPILGSVRLGQFHVSRCDHGLLIPGCCMARGRGRTSRAASSQRGCPRGGRGFPRLAAALSDAAMGPVPV